MVWTRSEPYGVIGLIVVPAINLTSVVVDGRVTAGIPSVLLLQLSV